MSPGLYLLGGSQGRGCRGTKCLVSLQYTHNVMCDKASNVIAAVKIHTSASKSRKTTSRRHLG